MTTVKTDIEHVMVVPTSLFHELGYFQGFNPETDRYLKRLLDHENTSYMRRDEMEQDPGFKQLIPYCLFRYQDNSDVTHIFQYTRGKDQGEERLHSKRSVGIGGHISTLDRGDSSAYEIGLNRELEEEVRIETKFEQQCVGLINDDENEVGKVHLGIVHIFDVASPNVFANESEIVEAGFQPVAKLIEDLQQFESWSQICLRELF